MIEQNVQVVSCSEEHVCVRLGGQGNCVACQQGRGCGAGVFSKLVQRRPVVIELLRQDLSVKPGQMITLSFPEQVYLKLVFVLYGWPLLAALLAASAGHALGNWLELNLFMLDLTTLLCALLAGALVWRFIKHARDSDNWLGSLHMAVYLPSSTPDMCSESE